VDTGVDITHSEFEGRAVWGANFADSNDIDCQGHGTHVAGTIGSKSFGVAKKTNLIAVKVLGCNGSGSYSGVLKGLEYVINKHRASNRTSVVNMSLGGPKSDIINKAIDNLVAAGIHVIVAAGNENVDACNTSPANNKNAITVAATTKDNKKAYFSNFGICVNILSPGTEILSTIPGDKTKVMQGTSMASPMVAGVFALILTENPGFKPDNMKRLITSLCTKNTISGFDLNTPNCFLYSLV
jgi:subtilisin family serine protease